MVVANTANALIFLVKAVLALAMSVFVLRLLLQLVRANFYNPISQVVWRLTQPVVTPLNRWLPRLANFDIPGALVLLTTALLYVWAVSSTIGVNVGWLGLLWFALLVIISLTLNIYFLCLFALAVLTWVGPGTANPAANVLWSLCEPLLRPVRRILPPVSGIDLSPVPVMLALGLIDRLLPLGPFSPVR